MKLSPGLVRALEADAAAGVLRAGLVGRGIRHSRTPGMHEAEGARLGLAYRYRLIDFDELGLDDGALEPVVALATELGFAGLNITHPFKERVVGMLDRRSAEVDRIGAVNTIVISQGQRTGHNTDSFGFAESFRRNMPGAALDHVVLAGAGGAGMAVGHALIELGAERITIFDLRAEKAAVVAGRLGSVGRCKVGVAISLEGAIAGATGVVNATPVGMTKYPGIPIPVSSLEPSLWLADIVYLPEETELLRHARALGCRTLGGSGMAVFQALRAFELITGRRTDPRHMVRHFAGVAGP